jgi:Co/Zn/Cd efflux system component
MAFGIGVLFDAGRRFFLGSDPLGPTMIVMALIAAVVNGLSIWLLTRLKEPDVNIRSATTFSTNDFISNAGILVAGGLVLWTGANWPDLAVGVAVAAIAAKGGIDILKDAQQEAENDS